MRVATSLKILTVLVIAAWMPHAVSAQPATTIRVANLELGTNLPIFYLPKLAAKYGLDIKIINFRRGVETAQALKAGEVDVALGGTEAAISAAASGTQVVILSNYCSGGVAWVTRPRSSGSRTSRTPRDTSSAPSAASMNSWCLRSWTGRVSPGPNSPIRTCSWYS